MENITIGQVWLIIAGVLGGISLILSTTKDIVSAYKRHKAPEESQNKIINQHSSEIITINGKLDRDNRRLDSLSESYRLSQRALFELLEHSINGNNLEAMKAVRNDLQQYLLNH